MYYKSKSTFYIRHFGSKLLIVAVIAVIFLFGSYSYISAADITPKNLLSAVDDVVNKTKPSNQVAQTEPSTTTSKKEQPVKEEVVSAPVETTNVPDVQPEVQKQEVNNNTAKQNKPKENFIAKLFNKNGNSLKSTKYKEVLLKDLTSNKISGGIKVVEVIDTDEIVVEDTDSTKYTVHLIGVTGLDETKYSREGIIAIVDELNQMLNSKLIQLEFDKEIRNADNSLNAYVYFNKHLLNADLIEKGYCELKAEKANTEKIGDLLIALRDAKANKVGVWKTAE